MEKILEKLNEKQREAVRITEGPLLVVAGAGSGKTLVLTHKIAYFIIEKGVPPSHIFAVTFTNKAAREMKERVDRILREHHRPSAASELTIGTFHSVCLSLLRTHAEKIGYPRHFVIFDDRDQTELLKNICEELAIDTERFPPSLFGAVISKHKSRLAPFENEENGGAFARLLPHVFERYQQELRAHAAVDFDDMIGLAVRLLESRPDVRALLQRQFRYILVDEYQDTNVAQVRLLDLLASPDAHMCAVGDLDQAIYSFREADIHHILHFDRDHHGTKIVTLEENYRSTQNILSAANVLISKNKLRKEKNLFTRKGDGAKLAVVMTQSEEDEAAFVAHAIHDAVRKKESIFSDWAVLYRTNAQSRAIEEALIRTRIPYVVLGGLKFYERKEVKDVLAYLRFVANPRDRVSLKRIVAVPPRGIGKVALEMFVQKGMESPKLKAFLSLCAEWREAQKAMPLSRFVLHLIRVSGMTSHFSAKGEEGSVRLENVRELATAASHYDAYAPEDALMRFLDNAALASREDEAHKENAARLMTVHSAKGLEFRFVFVTGMEDSVFPHTKSTKTQEELEEERRLCYVAFTRAKEALWLTFAQKRRLFGRTQSNPPSRFLFDIPEQIVVFSAAGNATSALDPLDLKEGMVDIEW